jgi:4-hydroxybenzoate polyprenyltransferase
MLLLYPCLWSTTLAYHALPAASLLPSLPLLALFSTGAIVMRGAGCTINDMWDRDIDKQVERTKTRPLASGDLTMQQATGFLAAQLSVGLGVLLSLPHTAFCFKLGAASLPLVALYPTAKRWTRFPQLVLGLTFNWGAFMGWAATYGDVNLAACAPLYVSGIAWTMVYDTLYAWQDKKDDETIGMKSTAITFGENTKPILHAFTAVFGTGLAMTGMATDMSLPYYLGIAASTSHLVWQVHTADFDDVDNLSYRFRSNQVVGAGVLASVVVGNFFC